MSYQEHAHSINGVEGRMFARHVWSRTDPKVLERARGLFSTQTWGASRYYKERGRSCRISVDMRFDDNCRNGHHTFSITGDIKERDGHSGGCIHEEIAKHFPELAPLIKWHLTSTDGPMHYIANTIYLASDRDYNGLRKGESRQIRNGKTGALAWIMQGQADRHFAGDAPPDETVTLKWEPWCHIGEGKERELDKARNAAVWPEATDAELCAEPDVLRAALEARAPALLTAFRADMEACGFAWEAP